MHKTTKHCEIRMQHRAIRPADLEFLEQYGTPVDEGYIMTGKAVQAIEREAKQIIATAERLKGVCMIVAGESVITAYKTDLKTAKRLLRK